VDLFGTARRIFSKLNVAQVRKAKKHCLRADSVAVRKVRDGTLVIVVQHADLIDVLSEKVSWHKQFSGEEIGLLLISIGSLTGGFVP
jgi:hypothetical protein